MRFRLSRRHLVFIGLAVVILIIVASLLYRRNSLWRPEQSLLALLPDAPVGYVSLKELRGLVETFQRSEFGKQTAKMPLLAEIQRELWWLEARYQKQLWEHEMGGKLDLKRVLGYFGEEAILGIYHRNDALSFLLVSVVGAKEKLEVATITATDAVNPKYSRSKERYRDIELNTITGYPREFSYAFVGTLGVLSTDKALVQELIDIYAGARKGFVERLPDGREFLAQYDANHNGFYIDAQAINRLLPTQPLLQSVAKGAERWALNNRYENGVIHSAHRLRVKSDWTAGRAQPLDERLLSLLPENTAFLSHTSGLHVTPLWRWLVTQGIVRASQNSINLTPYLKADTTVALLASPGDAPVLVPQLLVICPIADRVGLQRELTKLKDLQLQVNRKPLQFLPPQEYQGVAFYPAQLNLGFLLTLKGGHSIVGDYWVVSLTVGGLKAVIDTFTSQAGSLATHPVLRTPLQGGDTAATAQLDEPHQGHFFAQPNRLIPEVRRFLPMAGLMASGSGIKVNPAAITRISSNLFPLEALGTVTAGIDHDERTKIEADVRIVLEGPTE